MSEELKPTSEHRVTQQISGIHTMTSSHKAVKRQKFVKWQISTNDLPEDILPDRAWLFLLPNWELKKRININFISEHSVKKQVKPVLT